MDNKAVIEEKTEEFVNQEWGQVSAQSKAYLNKLTNIYKHYKSSRRMNDAITDYDEATQALQILVKEMDQRIKAFYSETDQEKIQLSRVNRAYGQIKNRGANYLVKSGIFKNKKISELEEKANGVSLIESLKEINSKTDELKRRQKRVDLLKQEDSAKNFAFQSYASLHQDIKMYATAMFISDSMTRDTIAAQTKYERWLNKHFFNREIIYAFVLYDKNGQPEKIIYRLDKDMKDITDKFTKGEGNARVSITKNDQEDMETSQMLRNLENLSSDSEEYNTMMENFKEITKRYDKAEHIVHYLFNPNFFNEDKQVLEKHNSTPGFLVGDIANITEQIKKMLSKDSWLQRKSSISIAVKALSSDAFQTEQIGPTIRFAFFAAQNPTLKLKGEDFIGAGDYTTLFEKIINSDTFKKLGDAESEKELSQIIDDLVKDTKITINI